MDEYFRENPLGNLYPSVCRDVNCSHVAYPLVPGDPEIKTIYESLYNTSKRPSTVRMFGYQGYTLVQRTLVCFVGLDPTDRVKFE